MTKKFEERNGVAAMALILLASLAVAAVSTPQLPESGQGSDEPTAADPGGIPGGFPGLPANAGVARQQSRDAIHPQIGEEVGGDYPSTKFVAIRISHCAAKGN